MSEDAKTRKPDEVEFGDKKVTTTITTRYQGRTGVTDRVAFISDKLLRAYLHWHDQKNFQCLSTEGKKGICCQHLGAPEQKFGAVLFHYTTDEDGELVGDGLRGKTKFWVFSEKRYEQLKPTARQHPLLDNGPDEAQVDLLLFCDEEQYQKITPTVVPGAHYKSKPEFYKAVTGKRDRLKEKLQLFLAPPRSEREVAEILGVHSGAAPSQADDDEVDLSDVMGEE
jgi:hypothetical protein